MDYMTVVIAGGARTAMGGMNGVFAGTSAVQLGATAIAAAIERSGLAASDIDEVIMGCVLPAGVRQGPAHVIDKGIPTSGLLAQVLIAKYLDHLPLYRQEAMFGRAGLAIPQSTLAQWVGKCGVALQPLVDALKGEMLGHRVLHADETPVAMLDPGAGKTHRAYLWCQSASNSFQLSASKFSQLLSLI